eukprot:CAMPEP_0114247574 /NCGR_PEP_ID=MMETSP0058-20121206/13096_1 /TAXON_ID=36894 /ORGANISM="Pyramimonas parkeae, CCMP726" /LENGTH=487 /DNA_ID=CAMNT_0001360891 /DNA_START=366 /DNA_END=1829 /DNA_ORIENTATION=+
MAAASSMRMAERSACSSARVVNARRKYLTWRNGIHHRDLKTQRVDVRSARSESGEPVLCSDSKFLSFTSSRPLTQTATIRLENTVNVLGLGQAMVDFAAVVEPELLEDLKTVVPDLEVGGRTCVDAEGRGKVITTLDEHSYKTSAGGSLSNTLVALSRLSSAECASTSGAECEEAEKKVDVSIACSLGPDYLGEFYRTKLKKAGVQVLSEPGEGGTTGSVIVLTTPDAQRTMLSCWGTSATLDYDDALDQAVASADMLVVEGYLWEMPETIASIKRALVTAKKSGVTVALTASDRSCVDKHRDEFWELLRSGSVDVFFANAAEAEAMTGLPHSDRREAVAELGKHAKVVVVTDGSHGSYLMRGSEFAHVPPHWLPHPPVDTCGAGDAYAAGCLYGIMHGCELHQVGCMGARVASVVIGHTGARLSVADAQMLLKEDLFRTAGTIQHKVANTATVGTTISVQHEPIKGSRVAMHELQKRISSLRAIED